MFKKVLSGVIALAMAASVAVVSASAAENDDVGYAEDIEIETGFNGGGADMGDADLSGKIDIEDAVCVINHINGVKALSSMAKSVADVDGNNKIDVEDAVAIINHVNGVKPIGGGGGTVTKSGKLEALRKKYSGDYTIKLKNASKGIEKTYIVGGNCFYNETKYDGVVDRFEVMGSDWIDYAVFVSDKMYFKVKLNYLPEENDLIGKAAAKFIKSETKGGMTYEYYQAADYVFDFAGSSGKLIFGFDSSSNLKTVEFKPDKTGEPSIVYNVVSIGKADKSKFVKPNLSGYTEFKGD